MIHFKDWDIWNDPKPCLQQNDNLRRLTVSGPLPEGWDWAMLVTVDQQMNVWPLTTQPDGGAFIILTAEQIGPGGFYRMQLRGTRGEEVRHSNVLTLFIPRSLSGDAHWPVLPTEFSDAERRILAARDEVAGYTVNPPTIQNGTWWLWNGTEYENSGTSATEPGPAGNGVVKYDYDPELWRWVMWYTNGHINTYSGLNLRDKSKFALWRDEFSTQRKIQPYHFGEDTFYTDGKPCYDIPAGHHGAGGTYGVATYKGQNALKLVSSKSNSNVVISRMHSYGGYIVQLNFCLESRADGDETTIGIGFDLFHGSSVTSAVTVWANHSGTYVVDSKTTGTSKTHNANFKLAMDTWYTLRMECRKGGFVVKVWPCGKPEPDWSGAGVLSLDLPWLDDAVLSEGKTLRIQTYGVGSSVPFPATHAHYIADLRMWEDAAVDGGVKLEEGTYIGTGTCGCENPNSLSFGFEPKMVVITGGPVSARIILTSSGASFFEDVYSSSHTYILSTFDGNSVNWYGESIYNGGDAYRQMNDANLAYHYLAIGQ